MAPASPDSLLLHVRAGKIDGVTQPSDLNTDDVECRSMEIENTDRRAHGVASIMGSSGAGCIGAFLVWNFIYSIGARVVDDQTYASLAGRVAVWGVAAGALAGLATVLLLRRPALGMLIVAHAIATVAGCGIGGSVGWREGLWAYFGALALFVMVVGYRALFRLLFMK